MADISLGSKVGVPVVLPTQTPWVAYTPTFNDQVGVSGVSFFTRQNGYNREISGRFTMATNNATSAFFSMPNGETMDTTFVGGANRLLGRFTGSNATAASPKAGAILANSADLANIYLGIDDASLSRGGLTATTWSAMALQTISFFMSVPTNFTIANAFTAYGAGLATSVKAGLISGEEKGSFIAAYSGSVSTGFANMIYARSGKFVVLEIVGNPGWTATATAPLVLSLANLPASCRRSATGQVLSYATRVVVNGAIGVGLSELGSLAMNNISFTASMGGGGFVSGQPHQVQGHSFTYVTD